MDFLCELRRIPSSYTSLAFGLRIVRTRVKGVASERELEICRSPLTRCAIFHSAEKQATCDNGFRKEVRIMKITIHPDSWVCLCGNKQGINGFEPCSLEGVAIPYRCKACLSKPKYYRCTECGRVVKADTMDVVSSTMTFGLHWLGNRILPRWTVRSSYHCHHA